MMISRLIEACLCSTLVACMVGWGVVPAAAATLRASCVKIDITPEGSQWLLGYAARQSEGVHDRLFHRIVALDDGKTEFILASSDLALVSPSLVDDTLRQLEKETGLKPQQIWWTATHTHSAPEVGPPGLAPLFLGDRYKHEPNPEYSGRVIQAFIEGIKQARARLEPARLGAGTGLSLANINRRAKDADGRVSLGLNPEGPVDRQIGLIRLERMNGSPLALIVNYAMHGTVLGGRNLQISGDAPGIVADYVEQKLGAPMLFINGAAGNVAPIYSGYADFRSGHITQFNVLLGDRILAANLLIARTTADVNLWIGQKVIETPRKPGLGWVDALNPYLRVTSDGSTVVRIPVTFLKINSDVLVWAAPLELFNEIAVSVRNHSPYPFTFYFGYSNGWLGYLTTAEAFNEGGYEPGVSPFTAQAEADFTNGVITYLQAISR
jgi:neutral ceramidase